MDNYTVYHLHSDLSLLDSCTQFEQYVDRAVELGQKAIGSTEHGRPLQWVRKKMYCDQKGIKFLFGVEIYLTKDIYQKDNPSDTPHKVRDNFHTVLIARDYQGLCEINQAVTISTDKEHTYYTNRMTFEEFLRLSPHVITTSACLASPLNRLEISDSWYEKLVRRYDFLEIQPHNHPEQIAFNRHLAALAARYHKPLIAGTDTHSLDEYKAKCRSLLMAAKQQSYGDEDQFDLTYKTLDELIEAFRAQDAIPETLWMEAIQNTNVLADMVEDFELDFTLKYPLLYGSAEEDRKRLETLVHRKYEEKLETGLIPQSEKAGFDAALPEELRVFEKIEMSGYMLCMSEMIQWCWQNDIPVGPSRGSVGGSRVAYVTDIIDLDPERWGTVFSRFANEDRKEVGDIDVDVIDTDRPRIFEYLIGRFGQEYTARVPTWGTAASAHTIEIICMGLRNRWEAGHGNPRPKKYSPDNPYAIKVCEQIKKDFLKDPEKTKKDHLDVFYYYDGILGTKVSQSIHAAGIVVSPVTLQDNYGCFWKDGELVIDIDMEEIHEVSLVKFDLLVVNNIGIIRDTCALARIPYPKSARIDFDDQTVWKDMLRSPIGIFQMEKPYAFRAVRDFGVKSIFDMALINACMRPSGETYRDDLIARKVHKNPSPMIDELLKKSNGFLCFQEDSINFLQKICGFSGSEADNIRRAIGRKDEERLLKALPAIIDGYCSKSPQPREVAEKEVLEFVEILKSSARYQFNYSHAVGYSIIGFYCAWLRCYYPGEFITTYLNHAKNDDDITGGTELAKEYGIQISPPRFEYSESDYAYDRKAKVISKGLSSIKGYGRGICDRLHAIGQKHYPYFVDALMELDAQSIKAAKVRPLIQIDYFASFGNSNELERILAVFDLLKQGKAKSISKGKTLDVVLTELLPMYATDIGTGWKELKSYTITDIVGLLHAAEDAIKKLGLPDTDFREKIRRQLEILGYVDLVTNRMEDRRRLIILDAFPLKGKEAKSPWGYAVQTRSIGTGKVARLTIRKRLYDSVPLKQFDVINASVVRKEQSGYWYLWQYEKL